MCNPSDCPYKVKFQSDIHHPLHRPTGPSERSDPEQPVHSVGGHSAGHGYIPRNPKGRSCFLRLVRNYIGKASAALQRGVFATLLSKEHSSLTNEWTAFNNAIRL